MEGNKKLFSSVDIQRHSMAAEFLYFAVDKKENPIKNQEKFP